MNNLSQRESEHRHSAEWLQAFIKKHGRPPRILHIGNIANNAYINARLLNKAGIDCDVICYNYYHIMGCPEWEDADFEGKIKDQFSPDWHSVDLQGFTRPEWFAQGPLKFCVNYLIARRKEQRSRARFWWKVLGISRYLLCSNLGTTVRNLRFLVRFLKLFLFVIVPVKVVKKLLRMLLALLPQGAQTKKYSFEERSQELAKIFAQEFPERKDICTIADLEGYGSVMQSWRELFACYDIVHAYATDGILPLLAGVPYVAYEHGTIRHIPFQNSSQGRLCALTYRLAHAVCITNADNFIAAKKLKLRKFSFVPHPVNEEFLEFDEKSQSLYTRLHETLKSDFIVFHPSRQHWEERRHPDWEKGNDIFIRGFARFVSEVNPRGSAIFVEWGKSVNDSKRLLEELKIAERVLWIQPLPNRKMIRYICATDLLADQFYLGAFGSTMPKALVCSKPAMLSLDCKIHEWCFDEMPPAINARTQDEVFEGLRKLYTSKEWAQKLCVKGKEWYEKYHSNRVVLERLTKVYREVLSVDGEKS